MLDIVNINKTFGSNKVLRDINLTINKGEMVALIGASGSGKSTLMKHLSGLLVSDKGSGRIALEGQTIQAQGRLAKDARRTRSKIGIVFQQFNLVGRLSVSTNVLLGALGRTPLWRSVFMAFSDEDQKLTRDALLKVGILEKLHQRASTLSGGQQQRAAIARTLVQKASIIVADEPIASLDPESSIMVMELLKKLNQEEKLTVLVSLHQVDFALKYCPRAVALSYGGIIYDGPSERLTVEKMKEIYGQASSTLFGSLHTTENSHDAPLNPPKKSLVAQTEPIVRNNFNETYFRA
ncbi:MAG: phosphonate ABC transporter ATP-binding protein [Deltaproteobacteria bacterium]|jgi:phosphonate transport system ATP-binding protein|nr:phosphonate ABC transporter ATP-binding protein [Deltaproteobacteria bacterium]